ncbi:MAG: hypothetical protein PHV97_04930, partial [Candidatus Omnitrophica bacterium]|nr:hypothetical protein [Candidatus Omnitrophota bacterium]
PNYVADLDIYANTSYPSGVDIKGSRSTFTISEDEDSPEIQTEKQQRRDEIMPKLADYLTVAAKKVGMNFRLANRENKSLAVYHPMEVKDGVQGVLEIDEGLAELLPREIDPASGEKDSYYAEHKKAFEIFLDDVFAQELLYAQGNDKWTIWHKRADYYKDHPDEYFYLADLLTNGKYETKQYPFIGEGRWGFKASGDYLTILRIKIPLEDFKAKNPEKPYFKVWELLDHNTPEGKDWPENFKLPVKNLWAITPDQARTIQSLFVSSNGSVRSIDAQLKQRNNGQGERIKVAIAMGVYKNGAETIKKKIRQLEELFGGTNIDWEVIISSHNSPDKSEKLIEDLLLEDPELQHYFHSGQVRAAPIPPSKPTKGKGGKIHYAVKEALREYPGHRRADIVVYTDPDLAVDLRQTGIPLARMLLNDYGQLRVGENGRIKWDIVGAGSRIPNKGAVPLPGVDMTPIKLPGMNVAEENLVTSNTRPASKAFKMTPLLRPHPSQNNEDKPILRTGDLGETQIGFKAYPSDVLEKMEPYLKDDTWTFDTEFFQFALQQGAKIEEVGVFWTDTDPDSSGTNARERWNMFVSWIEQYRHLQKEKALQVALKSKEPKTLQEVETVNRYQNPKTIEDEDLEILETLGREGAALAAKGQSTVELARDVEDLFKGLSDKYFSYPAKLNVERGDVGVTANTPGLKPEQKENLSKNPSPAKIKNLKAFLDARDHVQMDYIIGDRRGRTVSIFNQKTGKLQIDFFLAKIAPPFHPGETTSDEFQAFVNDLFRVAYSNQMGFPDAYALQDGMEQLRRNPMEAARIARFLERVGATVTYTHGEYRDTIADGERRVNAVKFAENPQYKAVQELSGEVMGAVNFLEKNGESVMARYLEDAVREGRALVGPKPSGIYTEDGAPYAGTGKTYILISDAIKDENDETVSSKNPATRAKELIRILASDAASSVRLSDTVRAAELVSKFVEDSRKRPDTVMVLSVVLDDWSNDMHGGNLLGTLRADELAAEMALRKYGVDYMYLKKQGVLSRGVFSDAGSATRVAPVSQGNPKQPNSRGAVPIVGTIHTEKGDADITLLLANVLQASPLAAKNDGHHTDVHYVSQLMVNRAIPTQTYQDLADPKKPYAGYNCILLSFNDPDHARLQNDVFDKVFGDRKASWVPAVKQSYVFSKFVSEAKEKDLTPENLRDLGIYVTDADGNMLENRPKGTLSPGEAQSLLKSGKRIMFSHGSHSMNDAFLKALDEQFGTRLRNRTYTKTLAMEPPDIIPSILMDMVDGKTKDEIARDTGKKKPMVKDYQAFAKKAGMKKGNVGTINTGDDILWWRHRRPAELYEEAMRMVSDMTHRAIRVDEEGNLKKGKDGKIGQSTEELKGEDAEADAVLMRDFKLVRHPIMNSQFGEVYVDQDGKRSDNNETITLDHVKAGIEIGGVTIKNSLIQNSAIDKGSRVSGSVVDKTGVLPTA